jgi:tetraacyldisaccharide 4'-kinase
MRLEAFWRKTINRKSLSLLLLPALGLRLASFVYRPLFLLKRATVGEPVALSVPTIAVGSITVGGSGKTPLTCFLAHAFAAEGIRVGIVSSGYGRSRKPAFMEPAYKVQKMPVAETSDEVMLMAQAVPEAVISVDSVKVKAAQRLADSGEIDVILIDDGFQHFLLRPDIHLVTYDAGVRERLLKLFPAGVLREPVSALGRADIIVITRANFAKDIARIRDRINAINPEADVYQAGFSATAVVMGDQQVSTKFLEDKSVFLFAGVGNFRALKRQVKALSGDLDYALELSDHQDYTPRLLAHIRRLANRCDSDIMITTAKDKVKLGDFDFGRDLGYLDVVIDLDPGEEKLVRYLTERLELPMVQS